MPTDLGILDALKKNKELELSVKGRVSGRTIPRPVWFVLSKNEDSVIFIPVKGRKTQWYLNVKKEPEVTIKVGRHEFAGKMTELAPAQFGDVIDAFEARYGDLRKWYPKLEVALEVSLQHVVEAS